MDNLIKSHETHDHIELKDFDYEVNFDDADEIKLKHGVFDGQGDCSVEIQRKKMKFILCTFKEDELEMIKLDGLALKVPFTIRLVGGPGPVKIYFDKVRHEIIQLQLPQAEISAPPSQLSIEDADQVVEEDKIDDVLNFSTDEEKISILETPGGSETSDIEKRKKISPVRIEPKLSDQSCEQKLVKDEPGFKRKPTLNIEDILSTSTPVAKRRKQGRGRPLPYPQLEKVMHTWISYYLSEKGFEPELALIVRQARSFAAELNIEKFNSSVAYSKGCLARYNKKKNSLDETVDFEELVEEKLETVENMNKQVVLQKVRFYLVFRLQSNSNLDHSKRKIISRSPTKANRKDYQRYATELMAKRKRQFGIIQRITNFRLSQISPRGLQ